ncbi:hypothetical protein JC2156_05630 [Weissella koreensis KCTC 3621]|uniref:phage antirepressor n=1 Tax=Weissella koreensis TaxID=165096 RepID=UPI00026F3EED|nr:phage antirepressor [Weissella koreensis]EJF33749.1 hypothetical protein JC2156_05630 [Weissella koreensis KCTC 3621]
MNEVQVFNFEQSNVRTVTVDNEPYFVGKDVAEVLGYKNTRKALSDHIDNEEKGGVTIRDSIGREQTVVAINESGVYSLIFGSKLDSAKRFKKWVTSEVLPSIRKTGGYQMQPQFNVPQTLPEALRLSADLAEQNAEMKPKAIFADAVTSSNTSILVGDLAKLLKQNGIDMGGRRLFEWLRSKGYLIRRNGADYNSPTQRSMEQGLFEIKESSHINGDGVNVIKKTPKVTGKGQQYFINKFLGADQTELDMEVM